MEQECFKLTTYVLIVEIYPKDKQSMLNFLRPRKLRSTSRANLTLSSSLTARAKTFFSQSTRSAVNLESSSFQVTKPFGFSVFT